MYPTGVKFIGYDAGQSVNANRQAYAGRRMCAAHGGMFFQNAWRSCEKLPTANPSLAPRAARLLAENKLMWPFRGAAYHQDSGRPGDTLPSDNSVLNSTTPSGLSKRASSLTSRRTSGTCSNTSYAVTRSNGPKSSNDTERSTNGS